jgi:hypothetical protein
LGLVDMFARRKSGRRRGASYYLAVLIRLYGRRGMNTPFLGVTTLASSLGNIKQRWVLDNMGCRERTKAGKSGFKRDTILTS